ncbi:hypothetical protein F2P56_002330, partial [Juglans regia]
MSPKHGLPAIVRSKRCFPAACSSFLLACLLAFTLQIVFFSPISPAGSLDLPVSSSASSLPANNKLQGVLKLGEGFLKDPEDVCVDKEGTIYAATRDGWIKRLHRNGSWENWKMMNSRTLLGITITKEGDLIVCDSEKGLIRIGEDGVNVLATHVNGSKIRFRCLKYWLKGEDKGKTEIFIDNLPGGPDNINLAPDGSFWIALLQLTSEGLEFVHTSKASKHLVATFPKLIEKVNGVYRKATVVNVAVDGKIIRRFDDPNGKVISFVTAAMEFEDHLYLGSLNSNFVGKLPLKDSYNL